MCRHASRNVVGDGVGVDMNTMNVQQLRDIIAREVRLASIPSTIRPFIGPRTVLLFDNGGDTARLHDKDCKMVNTARGRRGRYVLIDTDVEDNVRDLLEREYNVQVCRCLKSR